MASSDIGIDLGTASILVYVKGKGVVLKEPSVVAYDRDTEQIMAIGEEARLMLGRTPGNIVAVRPLRQGVISDYKTTEKMLKYFIQKAVGKSFFGRRPRISVCVPSGVTDVEKRAVEDATYQAGARDVYIIEEPVAAAIGAGIDISRPCGNMIVDIGGGTADIAVISLGGNIITIGNKPDKNDFVIGIENPNSNEYLDKIYADDNTSVVTSGSYQRYYTVDGKDYCHIIDKNTLYPANYFKSVTVISSDSALADTLSTALFCMDLNTGRKLAEKYNIQAIWLDKNDKITKTDGVKSAK